MSEMFIPTSVYDQSHDFQYGIFELIEADIVLGMMKDVFTQQVGMKSNYIIEPFTYSMQCQFRNSFNANKDMYKYMIKINVQKVILNMNPSITRDFNKLRFYHEGQTYLKDLARYRPFIRIQTIIDFMNSPEFAKLSKSDKRKIEEKRKEVIRDWFRLVLWYIRLRKAAKSFGERMMYNSELTQEYKQTQKYRNEGVPNALLKVECRIQEAKKKPINYKSSQGIKFIKSAKLA